MTPDTELQILETLREIRDDQREVIRLLTAQRTLAEDQLSRTQGRFEESVALQKEALTRQRAITRVAIPAILMCIAAIAYLVLRYF